MSALPYAILVLLVFVSPKYPPSFDEDIILAIDLVTFAIPLLANIYIGQAAKKAGIRLGYRLVGWLYYPVVFFFVFLALVISGMGSLWGSSWQMLELPEEDLGFYLLRIEGPPDNTHFLYVRRGLLPHMREIGHAPCNAIEQPFRQQNGFVYFSDCIYIDAPQGLTRIKKYEIATGLAYPENGVPFEIKRYP